MTVLTIRVPALGPYGMRGVPEILAMSGAGSLWMGANVAAYIPVQYPDSVLVERVGVYNSGNLTGTVDLGIYDDDGVDGRPRTLLASSGNAARANGSRLDLHTMTAPVTVAAGRYWLACVASEAAAGTYRVISAGVVFTQFLGVLEQTLGAATLPATATPIAYARTFLPIMGVSQSVTL